MSDLNKRILVSVIKKLADDGESELGGDVWTDTGGTGTRQPHGGGGGGAPAIIDMQKKMMELGQQVQAQMKIEDIAKQDDPQAQGEAVGRDSFSDFMAKMMRGSQPGGGRAQEFDPNPKSQQMGQKTPSNPARMWVLMDTIKRIGGPQSELKPDGVWGPRTNQALWNIRAFAAAILQLSTAFGAPVKSYSQQNLDEFILPRNEKDISPQDKIKSAPIIGQHLDAIGEMFQEFKDSVLNNPHYQTYIEDDTPFATIAPPKGQPGQPGQPDTGQQAALIGPDEAQEVAKIFPKFRIGFTGPDGSAQTRDMIVTDLITLQALEGWKKRNGVTLKTPDILNQVRTQVSIMPRRYTPQQDEAWQQQQWKKEQEAAKTMRKQPPGVSGQVNVRASSKR